MFGRKDYTQEELDQAKATNDRLLAGYRTLASAVANTNDEKARSALEDFQTLVFTTMVLALDRPFVHRLRKVTGKDGNPLNEVEVICESLMNNNAVMGESTVIKLRASDSVLKLDAGDSIRLNADDFECLANAFLAELERKFR